MGRDKSHNNLKKEQLLMVISELESDNYIFLELLYNIRERITQVLKEQGYGKEDN